MSRRSLVSTLTVVSIGLACKAFVNLGLCTLSVKGLPILVQALESPERNNGRGIITFSNHISTLDDPLVWAALPMRYFFSSRLTRWTMGASDIMFTNPLFSTFFQSGQVIETFRGKGVFQPAVDNCIEKLDRGEWIHIYPEGKVYPPESYSTVSGHLRLQRFKWGIGRMMQSTRTVPIILPIWITGFNQVMPLGRRFPFNYMPRIGQRMSITFGEPLPIEEVIHRRRQADGTPERSFQDLTSLAQEALEKLGKQVTNE